MIKLTKAIKRCSNIVVLTILSTVLLAWYGVRLSYILVVLLVDEWYTWDELENHVLPRLPKILNRCDGNMKRVLTALKLEAVSSLIRKQLDKFEREMSASETKANES